MGYSIRLATSLTELQELGPIWERLARGTPQRPELGLAFARAHAQALTPLVVTVASGEDRWGLLPLARRRDGRIEALGDVVEPLATDQEALGALLDAARRTIGTSPLTIGLVRGDEPHLDFFRRLLGSEGALERAGFSRSILMRPGAPPALTRDPLTRRATRTLESRFPIRHRSVDASHQAEAIAWMTRGPTHPTQRGAKEARLIAPARAAYLGALAATLAPGTFVIRALDARDEPIAMLAGLVHMGMFTALAAASSGELARYMPLSICIYRTLLWAHEWEISRLDLGPVEWPLGARWVDVHRPLYRLIRRAPRPTR